MRLEAKKFLYDIQSAVQAIKQFIDGKDLDDYQGDLMLQSAVERQFMILGEAMAQLSKIWPDIEEKISNVREIINFRNVIVHGYSSIENQTIWGIIEADLDILNKEVAALIE